ncbi:alpha/beta hydrolase family protein [Geminicoccus roseus]|uniref:alpha/beta hydrolase family protein n=1 Tax=Geminicoccus roseus TaxID=404900 RepID=UPI0003F50159|nr:hypothetical protein [Geminicoccus roseus]
MNVRIIRAIHGLALALAAALVPVAAAADGVGMRRLTVAAPERGTMLNVTLWYPAEDGGSEVAVGENAVFQGALARQDAPIAAGPFPLVLLSHGGLRSSADSGNWIAARLAADGFMVAAPQPPRLSPDQAQDAPYELALRPADLAATLTGLASEPSLSAQIDPQAVGALGFHLGGTAVLQLAGARIDPQLHARSCDQPGANMDCAWFARSGIDLQAVDGERIGASRLDPRIGAVAAVDPELTGLFTPESLQAIEVPVRLVNLGPAGAMLPGMDAAPAVLAIPGAAYERVEDAFFFSAFAPCQPKGAAFLEEEGEDPAICGQDGPPRTEIHAALAEMIGGFFQERLAARR